MQKNILKPVLTIVVIFILVGVFVYLLNSKSKVVENSNYSIKGKVTFGDCMPSPEPKKHDPYTGKIYFVAVSNLQSSQDRNAPNFFSVSPAASVIDGKYSANIPTGEYYIYLPGIPDTRNSITISPNQHLVKNLDYCTAY
ncbi:MAG: hypothetical protein KBD52_03235 [Candidatus Pacebacteria bacterium]|nr:hypothetical protein [Candidatus Paceibacterota bacterium]